MFSLGSVSAHIVVCRNLFTDIIPLLFVRFLVYQLNEMWSIQKEKDVFVFHVQIYMYLID